MSDDEKYYRETWMSDDQWQCALFWAEIMRGFHHIQGTFKKHGKGIAITQAHGNFATWDFNNLTRLVFLAHDRCIRVEIDGGGFGNSKFTLFKRHKRDGQMHERHPMLETAYAAWRKDNAAPAL